MDANQGPRRRWVRSTLATVLAAMIVGLVACRSSPRGDDGALVAKIDALAAEGLRTGPLAGVSIAISRNGRTVVAKGYGLADLARQVPTTSETVYRIGSLTKQFTAAAVLQLAQAGRLRLDDELATLLPDYPTQGRRVTVGHLLNHTSGIRDHIELEEGRGTPGTTRQSVLDLIAAQPFDFAPGERFSYSNSGYLLLGLVIERVSGRSYASYLEERVLAPAGLSRTSYCPDEPRGEGDARGYEVDEGTLVDAPPIEMEVPFAAGGLCSTVVDLVTWSSALSTGRVISDESYRMMTAPTRTSDGRTEPYGFGLALTALQGHEAVLHDGAINGFITQPPAATKRLANRSARSLSGRRPKAATEAGVT